MDDIPVARLVKCTLRLWSLLAVVGREEGFLVEHLDLGGLVFRGYFFFGLVFVNKVADRKEVGRRRPG